MLDSESVEDIGRVEPGVVAELAGDDLHGLGEALDDGLLLVGYVAIGEPVEVGGNLHFCGTTTANNSLVADGALDNHEGVVERALNLGDELLSTTSEDKSAGLGGGAALKEVEALATDLSLVEGLACAEMLGVDVGAGALDSGAGGLNNTFHIIGGHTTSAEDVAISEVLGSQVTNGELGEDNLGTGLMEGFELLEDDLPFGVDDGLVLGYVLDADLGVVLLGLELELDVQADNLGLLERLGLLLETGVGEGLLEGDTVYEEGVGKGTAGDLLDAY